ncbi:hypothetical protein S1OALGB6SA_1488 [Olavius algarvensis spirochete endosymbiont]|nr:hypothetical protein S1OALGB6SA_1488 [Olavius algarvensis spirochete endosymbiont]
MAKLVQKINLVKNHTGIRISHNQLIRQNEVADIAFADSQNFLNPLIIKGKIKGEFN